MQRVRFNIKKKTERFYIVEYVIQSDQNSNYPFVSRSFVLLEISIIFNFSDLLYATVNAWLKVTTFLT